MKPINNADFGKTADDYLTHQAGFLKSLFEKLQSQGIGIRNQGITDLGAGTGSLSLGFAAVEVRSRVSILRRLCSIPHERLPFMQI